MSRCTGFLSDCRPMHAPWGALWSLFLWRSTWMFYLPCVCTSVSMLTQVEVSDTLAELFRFFLCLVAMSGWSGCSSSLLLVHARTQTALTVHDDGRTLTKKGKRQTLWICNLLLLCLPLLWKLIKAALHRVRGSWQWKTQWAGWEIKHVTGFLLTQQPQWVYLCSLLWGKHTLAWGENWV